MRALAICQAALAPYRKDDAKPFKASDYLAFLSMEKPKEETPEERGKRMTQKVLALAAQLGAKRVET